MKMNAQTLAQSATGPWWITYAVAAIFAVMSVVLLCGKGAWMIAGYNTSSAEEKKKYNEKRLCRVVGGGFSVITLLIFVSAVFANVLPASFAYVILVGILVVIAAILILSATVCKVRQ